MVIASRKALALIMLVGSGQALAQDEPAGEITDEYSEYAGEEGEVATEVGESAVGDDAAGAAVSEVDENGMEDDTWESYSDLARVTSVADDVTNGIRIEDIVEPPTDYRFAAFGKSDPFVPPIVTKQQNEVSDVPGALEIPIVSPLQKYSLNQLKIVGIYSVPSGDRKALVLTPERAAVTVQVGDPIAMRGGKVLAIGEKSMTVREFFLAQDGTRQFDDLEMFLGTQDDSLNGARIRFEPGKEQTNIIENGNVVTAVENKLLDAETQVEGQAVVPPGGIPGQPGAVPPGGVPAPVPGQAPVQPGVPGQPGTIPAGMPGGVPVPQVSPSGMPLPVSPTGVDPSSVPAASNPEDAPVSELIEQPGAEPPSAAETATDYGGKSSPADTPPPPVGGGDYGSYEY